MVGHHVLADGTFGGRPPDLVHQPSGFRIWSVYPLGIITQVGKVQLADQSLAEFIATKGQELIDRRRRSDEHASYYHDWRRLQGYSPDARRIMTDWGLAVRSSTDRIVVALSAQAKIVKMGVSVASMALHLAGMRLDVVDDLQPTLDRLDVHPA